MKKRYENFMIEKSTRDTWWLIFKDGNFFATTPTEEEARRVIWLNSGKGEPITDEMLEVVQ
jgi:hypothetical protein